MKITVVVVAWGPAYLGLLVQQALPSLLSPGNLPALAAAHQVTCRFYTTPADAAGWAGTPLFAALARVLPVAFTDIASLGVEREPLFRHWPESKFKTMSVCHLDAIRRAEAEASALVFVAPDNLFSDGCFARVAEAIAQGCRAVLMSHIPVLEPSFLPAFARAFPADAAGIRALPPRALTRLALAHRHPDTDSYFPGGASFQVSAHLYWRVGTEGHLARAFHLHPLYLQPRRPTTGFFHSIDHDWTAQALDPGDPVRILQDSDEAALIEPLPMAAAKGTRPQPYPFTPLRWALAAEGLFQSPDNLRWARTSIRWHGADLSPAWAAVERQADQAVDAILGWMAFLDPAGWPAPALAARERREAEAMCADLGREANAFEGAGPGAPNPVHSWANLAKLCGAMGKTAEAGDALRHMVRLAGGNPHTLARAERLAQILLLQTGSADHRGEGASS
jgi:hypothetical protein